jgi:hypothetical protein
MMRTNDFCAEIPNIMNLLGSPLTVPSSAPLPPCQTTPQARVQGRAQFVYPLSPEKQTQRLLNQIFGFVKPILGLQLAVDETISTRLTTQSHAQNVVADYNFLKGKWQVNKKQFELAYQVCVDRLVECTDDIIQKRQKVQSVSVRILFLSFGLVLGFAGALARKKTHSWTLGSLACLGIYMLIFAVSQRALSEIQKNARIIYANLQEIDRVYSAIKLPHIKFIILS